MVRLYALLFVVQIILAVVALIGCLSAEQDEIRALPRLVWVMIILFAPMVGPIAWFLAGRPVPAAAGGTPATGHPFRPRERPRPVAPDDNPDFLKSLSAEQTRKDREMFDRWEQDLRRREDDLRRREADGSDHADGPDREERRPEP
nr:PLD nuclease N-terminal domain-containing protein [Micromonospora sp. DSM 115978]